jgi:diguanylate cyclase (GGDEF)-like protein
MNRATPRLLQPETLTSVIERKRLFDTAWVVCWVSLLAVVAMPWAMNVLDVDLTRAATFVFISGAAYFAVACLTDRLSNQITVLAVMRLMPAVGVVLLGILWHLVGGLANPTFLLAFTLPVVINGVIMVSRQAVITAALSSVVAMTVALAESNELRWYVAGGSPAVSHALDALVRIVPQGPNIFPEIRTPPAYQFTIMATFVVSQFLIAFLTTPLAAILLRLDNRLRVSHQMLNEVQGLFHSVLSGEPEPGAILYGDNYQIVQASDSFFHRMLIKPSQLPGKTLFDLINFDHPVHVREALRAEKGVLPFCVYRVGQEVRISNISFHRTMHDGRPYLYIGWLDLTEFYYLFSAFEALEEPLVLVGGADEIRYSNRAAQAIFGDLHFGKKVGQNAALQGIVAAHAREAKRIEMLRVELGGHPYLVHHTPAPLPGAGGMCTIFWFHNVEKEEALFEQAVRDPLTGLYNRRFFDEALTMHVDRRKRGHALALGYFDLDNFKTTNDTEGHAAGDAVLKAFVAAVRSELRDSDIFARRGGDEFSVLFVDCGTDIAAAAIERVHARVGRDGASFEGRRLTIGFSAGIAACRMGDTVEDLLERADQALYKSKAAGKGRCSVVV